MQLIKLLIVLLFSITCLAQVQDPVGTMYEPTFPELQAWVVWPSVLNATGYKIYENVTALEGQKCPTTDSSYIYDTTVTTNSYLDDPNPGWYLVDVNNRGGWQNRWWCYEITSIVNGHESTRSKPVQVAIGSSGYVTMRYQSSCTDPVTILPFPYSFSQMHIHLYYKDSNKVVHEIPFLTNATTYADEVEWKIPVVALDGTIVPLPVSGASFYYTWQVPDLSVPIFGYFMPSDKTDEVSYSQVREHVVKGVGTCKVLWEQSGGSYINTQGVNR